METRNPTVWPASFAGPLEIELAQFATVCAPAFSPTVWLAPVVKEGAWFTRVSVIVKLSIALESTPPLAVPPLSPNRT